MFYYPYLAKLVLLVSWMEDNPSGRFYRCLNYSVLFDFKPGLGFFSFFFKINWGFFLVLNLKQFWE